MWRKGAATFVTGVLPLRGRAYALIRHLSLKRIRPLGKPAWRVFAAVIAATCLLSACVPPSANVTDRLDLSKLEMDPSRFLTIALRDDIEIKTAVIHTETAATRRTLWYVLEYIEQENRKGFAPDRESEYTNLFFVNQVQRAAEGGASVRRRYLIVDSWRYYPAQRVKTCHQWTIQEDDPSTAVTRASFQFLVEDFNNVLLEERVVSLDPQAVERLGDFYQRVKGFLSRRVKDLPVEMAHRID
jgi:hypothetical protein